MMSMINKTICFGAALFVAMSVIGAPAIARPNPKDIVSNPSGFKYPDVEIAPPDMSEPFVRDGIITDPQIFSSLTPGRDRATIQATLGAPVRSQEREWDYNFRFKMPYSENLLVCQYKVIFDDQQRVSKTVWRRRQCEQLAKTAGTRAE